ncbi:hypothetical protein [Cohnella hashimotonis]|uniref:Uncharacterized protein n=1 Tax=Cohnella hashimotonis TaxID=2826895 RepID=A0ABT6THW1_9BACL|nr:hypothetical protein [Cohnella hashimotonis]MDI4646414.1 hypothetical protein [Cohnella hashimotonis]
MSIRRERPLMGDAVQNRGKLLPIRTATNDQRPVPSSHPRRTAANDRRPVPARQPSKIEANDQCQVPVKHLRSGPINSQYRRKGPSPRNGRLPNNLKPPNGRRLPNVPRTRSVPVHVPANDPASSRAGSLPLPPNLQTRPRRASRRRRARSRFACCCASKSRAPSAAWS